MSDQRSKLLLSNRFKMQWRPSVVYVQKTSQLYVQSTHVLPKLDTIHRKTLGLELRN